MYKHVMSTGKYSANAVIDPIEEKLKDGNFKEAMDEITRIKRNNK